MGAVISSIVFQPILLGTATMLMIIALIYQNKSSTCGSSTPDTWGVEIFKLEMIIAIMIIITAVIINFISGFEI